MKIRIKYSVFAIWVCIIVIATIECYAQKSNYIGVKGGVNFTEGYFRNQFFVRTQEIAAKQGLNGFLVYRKVLGKYTGYQLEAGYIEKGWKQTFDGEQPAFITDLNYGRLQFSSYFHLPLWNEKTQLFLTLGPFIDRLVSNKRSEFPDFVYLRNNAITFFTYEESRDFEIGYGIGGNMGFQRKIGPGDFFVEGMLSVSLSRIIDSGQPNLFSEEVIEDGNGESLRLNLPNISSDLSYGISAGYLIPFGKSKVKYQ